MQENSPIQQPAPMPVQHEVSFPEPKQKNGNGRGSILKWIIVFVGIIVIVGGGILFLANSQNRSDTTTSPTPDNGSLSTFPTPEPTVEPTLTPTATPAPVDKASVKVNVLNGTGTPGGAGFLQVELEKIDFEDIEVGNADSQNETTTTVTYTRDLSPAISDEITALLEKLYDKVETKKASISGGFDVKIVTGDRKSSSSTAKATATPTASPADSL